MPDYDWGPDEPEVAETRRRAKRRRAAAKARPKDSPGDAAIMLSLVIGTYQATRAADWEGLRRGPLEAAVATLTAKHEPAALEAPQAAWLSDVIKRFARLFPETYEAVRLGGAQYGFEAIAGALGTKEISAEEWRDGRREGVEEDEPVRRRFADPRHEVVRPRRPPGAKTPSWVI